MVPILQFLTPQNWAITFRLVHGSHNQNSREQAGALSFQALDRWICKMALLTGLGALEAGLRCWDSFAANLSKMGQAQLNQQTGSTSKHCFFLNQQRNNISN